MASLSFFLPPTPRPPVLPQMPNNNRAAVRRGTAAAGWGIRRRSISQKMKHVFKVGISLGNLCLLIVKMLKIDIFCPYSFVSFSFVVSSFLLLPFSLLRSVCLLDLSSWILDSDADFRLPLSDFERKRRKGRGFGLQFCSPSTTRREER